MMATTRKQKYLQPAIRGKIANLLDTPVAFARVILSGTKLKEKMSSVTGVEGLFMFNRVPPGSYTLEIVYSGFSRLVQSGIAVRDHAITGLDMKMDFLEDSRSIKLRALKLEYVNDPRPEADRSPSILARQVAEVVAGLTIDRILFSPPTVTRISRPFKLDLGVHQNLKAEVMRRLLERRICRFDREQIELTLSADVQVQGCRVLLTEAPLAGIDGAGFLEWKWEILPETAGLGRIRLQLETEVLFTGYGSRKKILLTLDRSLMITEKPWFPWRQFIRSKINKFSNK